MEATNDQKVFRINMSNLSVTVESVPEAWNQMGGRGITSTVVAAEVPPTCHPLGPNNKLIFAPGLLSGTSAPSSGRISAGAKSPLTGGIKESTAGGTVSQILSRLGVKAIIIEGMPEENTWYNLHCSMNGMTIQEEKELIGKDNFEVIQGVEARLGKKIAVITIGTAGERKMAAANISVKDTESKIRSLGRGGLGAVMGSKRIKFISVDGTGAPGVKLVDSAKFLAAVKVFMGGIAKHPSTSKGLPYYGTDATLSVLSSANFGALPTHNFSLGSYEHQDKINGDALHDTIVARGGKYKHGCNPGCVMQCSQVYVDKDHQYVTSGFEYETIGGLGADCGIPDLDIIAKADYIMDDIGVDAIEMVIAFGLAMEAGILPFGDGPGVLRLLSEEVAHGTPLGRILGSGTGTLGKVYGMTRVPVVKNQALALYDPRAIKGIGITFATSPMGADHTAGYTLPANLTGAVPPRGKEGQIALSRQLQIMSAAFDGLGMCSFASFVFIFPDTLPALMDMINARSDGSMTPADFVALGTRILKMEHQFNLDAGLSSKDDRLPEFFSLEAVPPTNAIWDFTGEEIDTFWDF